MWIAFNKVKTAGGPHRVDLCKSACQKTGHPAMVCSDSRDGQGPDVEGALRGSIPRKPEAEKRLEAQSCPIARADYSAHT
jgi:hypothetical protein